MILADFPRDSVVESQLFQVCIRIHEHLCLVLNNGGLNQRGDNERVGNITGPSRCILASF